VFELAATSIRSGIGRFVATIVAIATGIAFFVSGSMLTSAVSRSIGGEVDAQYAGVDAAVIPTTSDTGGGPGGGPGGDGFGTSVPDGTIQLVQTTDGVANAAGEYQSIVTIIQNGKRLDRGGLQGEGVTIRNWVPFDELNPLDIVDGRAPDKEGEVAIDLGLAEDLKVEPGGRIELGTSVGPVPATVVGLTSYGTTDSLDPNGTISVVEPWVFELAGTGETSYSRILISAIESTTPTKLVRALTLRLPESVEAVTGAAFRTIEQGAAEDLTAVLKPVITGFSILSLVVCAFVIFNTFSVVVSQRSRELALLRAVAATPGQVTGSLCLEGVLVGVLGSLTGLAAGVGLSFGLAAVLEALDLGLPPARITISPSTLLTGLVVGVIVTVLSVLLPAFRGSRAPPVAALREAAVEPKGLPKIRVGIAAVLVAFGIIGVAVGDPWGLLVGAAFALFFGVFLLGPALALGWSKATALLLRPLGIAPKLASENIGRHPRRTSATANALVIGLLLVTLVSVAGNSLKSWAVQELNELTSADFIVGGPAGAIPPDVLDRMEAVDGVEAIARLRSVTLTADGQPVTISSSDSIGDLEQLGIRTTKGDLNDLGVGLAVSEFSLSTPLGIGDSTSLVLADGQIVTLPVTAILETTIDSIALGSLASPELLNRLSATPPEETTALISAEPGKSDQVGEALADIVADSNVFVLPGNFIGQAVGSAFDFLINTINGLLGISVLVALIGIVNTLSLSIFERRHELGLLRAVGMSTGQVRVSVRIEALLMSLLGTLVGMAAGVFLAWGLTRSVDLGFSMPWGRLGLILGLGVLLGLLASILPSRRATRGAIVEALAA